MWQGNVVPGEAVAPEHSPGRGMMDQWEGTRVSPQPAPMSVLTVATAGVPASC